MQHARILMHAPQHVHKQPFAKAHGQPKEDRKEGTFVTSRVRRLSNMHKTLTSIRQFYRSDEVGHHDRIERGMRDAF